MKYLPYIFVALAALTFAFWVYEPKEISLGATSDTRPDGTTSETGGSCDTTNAHTTLDDDPDSPGGDLCSADADLSNHDIQMTLATPALTPGNSTNGQTMKVLARNSKTSGTGQASLAMQVLCGGASQGTVAQSLGDTLAIISLSWTFSAAACSADGSGVEVLLNCTAEDNGGTNNDTSCTYDAVEWVANDEVAGAALPIVQDVIFFD